MKKVLNLIILLLLLLTTSAGIAGTISVGVKGWYAYWDGVPDSLSKIVDDDVDEGIEEALSGAGTVDSNTESSKDTGKGFLTGPVLAYQSDDRLWSLSLALMYFSSFKYSTTSEGTITIGPPTNQNGEHHLDYSIDLKRREIDIALSRSVSARAKVFAGYKYQSLEHNLSVTGPIYISGVPVGDVDTDTEIKITSHIPTAGAGYVFPVSESIFLGLQAGVIYIIPEYTTETTDNISGEKSDHSATLDKTFGINLEAAASFLFMENLIFQAGYRYQGMRVKHTASDEDDSIDVWDSFQGVTFSALYLFNP
ncbi:MAG TPA: hypothetical protein PK358_01865 [Spirochaetota bacterium]|nr:hypothetical protein [Spirochaetota bacterium]HPJ33550.1 hypothetical protein [Spirochaetota bacterium]